MTKQVVTDLYSTVQLCHESGLTRSAVSRATLICICLLVTALAGCSTVRRLMSEKDSEAAAAKLQELQLKVMRYADGYVGGVIEPLRRFQLETNDPIERLAAQDWKLSQATAAYSIASGPNPVTNSLDLVVLATLSRMVMEDTWVDEKYGERAAPIRDAHRRLEPDAWSLAAETLTGAQMEQLHQIITKWRAQNPHVRAVSYVHFRGFAQSIGEPKHGEVQPLGSLFSLIGIDPLSALDPAVREIAQTRHLAERTIYYVQRAPLLLDMEVERMTYVFASMPETRTVLDSADRASRAVEAAGDLAEGIPALIASEREAAIHQFMQELGAQQGKMLALASELRAALEAGNATSDSIQHTVQELDAFIAQFRRKGTGAPAAPRRPFDIKDYGDAAREFAATAQQIQSLLAQLDAASPRAADLAAQAMSDMRLLVSFAFWRLVVLVLLIVGALLAAAIAYRWVSVKIK